MVRGPGHCGLCGGACPDALVLAVALLADDELDELAADIAERGLLYPVVLDPDGRVLDGRNRLAACERAGVEPAFTTYEGDDADGYALAVNIARRNLLPKQRYLITEKARRRTQKTRKSEFSEDERPGLYEAAVVLDWAPERLQVVLAAEPGDEQLVSHRQQLARIVRRGG